MLTKLFLFILAIGMLAATADCQTHTTPRSKCSDINDKKRLEVTTYVASRFHVQSLAYLTLISVADQEDSCFTRFTYSIDKRLEHVVVYLSPDQTYITPQLWDIRKDPAEQQRVEAEKFRSRLLEGAKHIIGDPNADVTIIEFSDFECPFCRKLAETLRSEGFEQGSGGVRLIYRQFPLPGHPWAFDAARMTECVSEQHNDLFWKAYDVLFGHQQEINKTNLESILTSALSADDRFNAEKFSQCVAQHQDQAVNNDVNIGRTSGVKATPTLFINGVMSQGVKTSEEIKKLIDDARHSAIVNTKTD